MTDITAGDIREYVRICPACGTLCGPRPFVTLGEQWFHGDCFFTWGTTEIEKLRKALADLIAIADDGDFDGCSFAYWVEDVLPGFREFLPAGMAWESIAKWRKEHKNPQYLEEAMTAAQRETLTGAVGTRSPAETSQTDKTV